MISLSLAALIVAGCGSTAPSATADKDSAKSSVAESLRNNPDYHELSSSDGTFTLVAPKDWFNADMKDARFAEAMKKLGNPDAQKSIEQITSNPVIRLVAMDVKGIEAKKLFVDNLNVVVMPAPAGSASSDMSAAAVATAKQLFGTSPYKTDVFDTPNGRVGMYSGATSMGSPQTHDLIGGLLVHGDNTYTVTLSCEAGKGAGFDKVFRDVMQSLKFK